ncbi:hypothetical protein [Rhizobium tibeticum]
MASATVAAFNDRANASAMVTRPR